MLRWPPHEFRDASQGPSDTPVQIWQRTWEFESLLAMYREVRPERVLEIGSYMGGTLFHFLGASRPGTLVVSVDTYHIPDADHRSEYEGWVPEGVELQVWEGSSHDPEILARALAIRPLDFVFIDGDHSEAAVRADWTDYHPLVRPGGLFVMHDILPSEVPHIEVAPVWREIQRLGFRTTEIVANPDAEWGGIGVVHL